MSSDADHRCRLAACWTPRGGRSFSRLLNSRFRRLAALGLGLHKCDGTRLPRLAFVALLCVLVASAAPEYASAADESKVTPSAKTLRLSPGDSADIDITVKLGEAVPKADVLFVFDVTSSMSSELDQAKDHGRSVMNSVKDQVANTVFGVASFCDYPGEHSYPGYSDTYGASGDYAWSLDRHLTGDVGEVDDAIGRLTIRDGQDGPECYARVVSECADVKWRKGSKRVVVLFGDAPPHDLDFGGKNFGGDPGPDQKAGTADDIDFETAVAKLAAIGVQVIVVDTGTNSDAEEPFKYIAEQTSGTYTRLEEASDLPDTVEKKLKDAVSNVNEIALSAAPGTYTKWLTKTVVVTGDATDVEAPATIKFRATITMPADAKRTDRSFTIGALADGALLGSTAVNVIAGKNMCMIPFEVKEDGFSFKNTSVEGSDWSHMESYFGRPMCVDDHGERLWAAQRFFDLKWSEPLDGACFGMAMGSMAIFEHQDGDYLMSGGTAYELGDPASGWPARVFKRTAAGNSLSDFLIDYFHRQNDFRLKAAITAGLQSTPSKVEQDIVTCMDGGHPVSIGIYGDGGHAVVGYAYERRGSKTIVRVYDNNSPGEEDRQIVIDRAANTWSSNLSGQVGKWTGSAADSNIAARPLSTVLGPGVAPWNPTREHNEDAGVLFVAGSEPGSLRVDEGDDVVQVPTMAESPSATAPFETSYFLTGKSAAKVTISPDKSVSALALGAGTSWAVNNVSGGEARIQAALDGSIKASTGADAATCDVSISREASASSRVYEVNGVDAAAGGQASLTPSDDFSAISLKTGADQGTYDVAVHSIQNGRRTYRARSVQLDSADVHRVVAGDWASLDTSPPVIEVDRDSDGSIDETIPLTADGRPGGGGGPGPGGDGGLLMLVLALTAGGSITWLAAGARSSSTADTNEASVLGTERLRLAGQGVDWVLPTGATTIGREPDNDVVLSDPAVSRYHARISSTETGVFIQDLGSSLGTHVNGERVERQRLRLGDRIVLGNTTLDVEANR